MVGWLLEFYILVTSRIISGRVTVHTYGHFIVLPHWETRPSAPWSEIPLSHIIWLSWHWTNQSIHYTNSDNLNAERLSHLARKQVSMFTALVWLDQGSNPWVQIPRSTKTGDGRSTHSAIPSGQEQWNGEDQLFVMEKKKFSAWMLQHKLHTIKNNNTEAKKHTVGKGEMKVVVWGLKLGGVEGYLNPSVRGGRVLNSHLVDGWVG